MAGPRLNRPKSADAQRRVVQCLQCTIPPFERTASGVDQTASCRVEPRRRRALPVADMQYTERAARTVHSHRPGMCHRRARQNTRSTVTLRYKADRQAGAALQGGTHGSPRRGGLWRAVPGCQKRAGKHNASAGPAARWPLRHSLFALYTYTVRQAGEAAALAGLGSSAGEETAPTRRPGNGPEKTGHRLREQPSPAGTRVSDSRRWQADPRRTHSAPEEGARRVEGRPARSTRVAGGAAHGPVRRLKAARRRAGAVVVAITRANHDPPMSLRSKRRRRGVQ